MDIVREVLSELDKNNLAYAKEIALYSLQYIDNVLVEQIRGIAYLHNLFEVLSNKKRQ